MTLDQLKRLNQVNNEIKELEAQNKEIREHLTLTENIDLSIVFWQSGFHRVTDYKNGIAVSREAYIPMLNIQLNMNENKLRYLK